MRQDERVCLKSQSVDVKVESACLKTVLLLSSSFAVVASGSSNVWKTGRLVYYVFIQVRQVNTFNLSCTCEMG